MYRDMPAIVNPDLLKDEQSVDMGTALAAVLVSINFSLKGIKSRSPSQRREDDALLAKGRSNLSILKDDYGKANWRWQRLTSYLQSRTSTRA
jgi:hypothetical protein